MQRLIQHSFNMAWKHLKTIVLAFGEFWRKALTLRNGNFNSIVGRPLQKKHQGLKSMLLTSVAWVELLSWRTMSVGERVMVPAHVLGCPGIHNPVIRGVFGAGCDLCLKGMFAGGVQAFSDGGSAWNGCGAEETNGTTQWLSVSTTCDPCSGGQRGVAAAAGGFAGFGCSLLFLLLFELATF